MSVPQSLAKRIRDDADFHVAEVLMELRHERTAQEDKWGEQDHPNGTGLSQSDKYRADQAREWCDYAARIGRLTWRLILEEEIAEAFAESDPAKLREELIQVAAVAVAWVQNIDRDTRATQIASSTSTERNA